MWLLPLLLLWALALRIQTLRSEAQSDEAHDRVLLGSALVIAERMAAVDGLLMVDIPPAALQMLEVQAQDRVFYKVSCLAPPAFIAGTPELETDGLPPADATPVFTRARHGDLPVRQVRLRRPVAGVAGCSAALVSVAETRVAREALSRRIMLDATLTQLTLLGGAAALIVFGVRRGLQPLRRLRDEIRGRDEQDLSPIDTGTVPREVVPLIDAINQQMQRQRGVNEAHHRFVADATHQLKTPLAVLRTQAELALGQQDPARMRAYVEELRDGTETTARVVHQLLALLRSDPMALHGVESLDLVEAAREASFELLPLALAKSIDLAFDGGPAAAVRVHGVLLHELVANLVDNAIRYTPARGCIRVDVQRCDQYFAVLEVADSGPGIPPREREKVFSRFYRLPDAGAEGCGLGLAIVQQIAERYGATVALDTAREGGLRVTVRFRIAETCV